MYKRDKFEGKEDRHTTAIFINTDATKRNEYSGGLSSEQTVELRLGLIEAFEHPDIVIEF